MTATLTPLQYAEQWREAAINSAKDGNFEAEQFCIETAFKFEQDESRAEPSCGKEQPNA